VHRAYDEATAVLAGDALQTAAFEILAHPDTHSDGNVRAELVMKLARRPARRAWRAAR
jgi:farnesyl diphosphate synthase